jgi:predicted transcriptional regulator
MAHMRSLEVLNTVLDREEEAGFSVVRQWVEGDLIQVNVSPFTEVFFVLYSHSLLLISSVQPQGEGIIKESLVSFEATLHRHDHPHDCGVQRVSGQ